MKGYLQAREQEKFQVLGVVGINGSPSCGVKFTCSAPWGGEFSSHNDLPQLLRDVRCVPERGVLMEVLSQMMQEEGMIRRWWVWMLRTRSRCTTCWKEKDRKGQTEQPLYRTYIFVLKVQGLFSFTK